MEKKMYSSALLAMWTPIKIQPKDGKAKINNYNDSRTSDAIAVDQRYNRLDSKEVISNKIAH